MLLANIGIGPRLRSYAPKYARSVMNKSASRPVPEGRVFPPIPNKPNSTSVAIRTPHQFLTAIGRSCQEKMEPESWDTFWRTSGHDMKNAGLSAKDRRYILWCMEKYRSGYDPREFAYEVKSKKTIRGWGPAVQNGKRIRSRRQKN